MPQHTPQIVYTVEQRDEFCFAVLGPNPDAGKQGVCYSGDLLTVCTTDGADDAALIASALNLHAATLKYRRRRPVAARRAA